MKKAVKIKDIFIGGDSPISIQSMCSISFDRFEELKNQALLLQEEGCDILRVSVPDTKSLLGFKELKKILDIPLVADIHFSYKLALEAIDAGADKIRINPGNIGTQHIKEIADAANAAKIPIRVGVNAGSLEKEILKKHNKPTAQALAESAINNVQLLQDCNFDNIVVSMKSSDVKMMVESYKIFHEKDKNQYPLHLGVTEAGTLYTGIIKSSIGIGALLLDGIGDTIRISLTANPIEEIKAAKILLRSLGLKKEGIEVISCPTCGRTTTDTIRLANFIESEFSHIKKKMQIAVMGCVVNGPGESMQADLGVSGANGEYILFKKGEILKKVPESEIYEEIKKEINEF